MRGSLLARSLIAAPLAVAAVGAALLPEIGEAESHLGAPECVRWHRPGRVLFYKDTAVHAVGISLPSELVAAEVPAKRPPGEPHVAPFAGSRMGGDTKEYSFGPGDEDAYHAWYAQHRFALTRRKGGWDALRHPEILAAGSVPLFENLAEAPPYSVPFVPVEKLVQAERELSDYTGRLEAAYNATVRGLLEHTRNCLTAEAMAAHILRTMGLWPTSRPLRVLYVSCGWGWSGTINDGWQGPVSIGLFIGLQRLLARVPGSRVVDAPPLPGANWTPPADLPPTYLWYTYEQDTSSASMDESDARRLMYGYGFSYARRLPPGLMASVEERRSVIDDIHRHAFDAVVFGKVGPAQGCEPLPYFDEVQQAGYPAQRIAMIYGGDFGLQFGNTSRHIRLMGGLGTVFVREIDADPDRFEMRPTSVLPASCYMENEWRMFFKLWEMRLECWGCPDLDAPVVAQLWPIFRRSHGSLAANDTGINFGAAPDFNDGAPLLGGRAAACWSGLILLAFPLFGQPLNLAQHGERGEAFVADACTWVAARLLEATRVLASKGTAVAERDFLEAFGVRFSEVKAFICSACGGSACRRPPGRALGGLASPSPESAVLFDAHIAPGDRVALAELRQRVGVT